MTPKEAKTKNKQRKKRKERKKNGESNKASNIIYIITKKINSCLYKKQKR